MNRREAIAAGIAAMNRREVTWKKRACRLGAWTLLGALAAGFLWWCVVDIGWFRAVLVIGLAFAVTAVCFIATMLLVEGYSKD